MQCMARALTIRRFQRLLLELAIQLMEGVPGVGNSYGRVVRSMTAELRQNMSTFAEPDGSVFEDVFAEDQDCDRRCSVDHRVD